MPESSWHPSEGSSDDEEEEKHICDAQSARQTEVFISRYLRLHRDRPYLMNTVTSAAIGAMGAFLGNYFSESKDDNGSPLLKWLQRTQATQYWKEVGTFALFGGLVVGPVTVFWQEFLSKHGPESPSTHIVVDQLIAQPPRIFLTFILLDVLRAAIDKIPSAWERSSWILWDSVAASWAFWPVATYGLYVRVTKLDDDYLVRCLTNRRL